MDNNDRLIRIRYGLNLSDKDMIKIFKLSGYDYSLQEVLLLLTKSKDAYFHDDVEDKDIEALDENIKCSNEVFEGFLNGLIAYKRGVRKDDDGNIIQPPKSLLRDDSVNNVMLKKLKIALDLKAEDMIEIFASVGVTIGKSELGGLFRKEGHKHYRVCGENYARKFLKALTLKYNKTK